MKNILRYLAKLIASKAWLYKLYMPFIYLNNYVQAFLAIKKSIINNTEKDAKLIAIIGEPIVRNGSFKGMRYPAFESVCSTIYPKIIGSYESELNDIILQIISRDYELIIDVGCAEGYYAVGLAMQTDADVFAYDTDEDARKLCSEMAKLNGVENKIHIKETFTNEDIKNLDSSKRTVLICDCEGYEKTLFSKDSIPYLKNTDLLIETHDFIDLTISSTITDLLTASHSVKIISSIDDNLKAKYYKYKEVDQQDIYTRRDLLKEVRPCTMEWIWATSKNNIS